MTPISIKTINDRTSRKINALATNANLCFARLDSKHLDLVKDFSKEHKAIPAVFRTNEDSYRSVLRFDLGNGHYIQGAFSPADGWSWQGVYIDQEPSLEFLEDFYQGIFLSLLTAWVANQFINHQ